ncbi:toll/interleukin-1 receptor domain-containing protein [Pyxidicoccus parkwayensis]|uniref:Toll/interleukin-1 receptor domain-containing protein n=1 Tax=Pyxidicoccus parkwayensis TaxID=2813578 RepID=A0ABX7P7E0_9BACT|nr:toll/interleukin-1 receptor domain-containing protein [Pyxidicoccus parkwaysis]QSQ26408.1 toll/interleukin-1 receptor domain-containing protein [Pyxidicoccus parkwaysis]
MSDAVQPERAFISYASGDRSRVLPILDDLRALGTSSWLDIREVRAGDRLTATLFNNIEKCASVVVMLTKASAGSEWVKREVAHALAVAERGHALRIIPCRIEACEPLASLNDFVFADFTTSYASGMRELLGGLFRNREVVNCRIDPTQPLQLLEAELRPALAHALAAREGIPELIFHLDATDLRTELRSMGNPYSGMLASLPRAQADYLLAEVASNHDQAPLLLRNLPVALGTVAREVFSAWQRRPGLEEMLVAVLQATAWLVLYDYWRIVRGLVGRDFTRLKTVQGEVLQHVFDDPAAQNHIDAGASMTLFRCAFEELRELGLKGRAPVADGRLWVPDVGIPSDTLEHMRHHLHPIPPSSEILDFPWLLYFVPGLARSHVWNCSHAGLRLADNADRFSVSKQDYAHMGPT